MKKLDLRSALLGLTAGVLITFCVGAATTTDARGPVGRFQIGATHSHAFVIDTVTGRVWHDYFHAGVGGSTDKDFRNPKLQTE